MSSFLVYTVYGYHFSPAGGTAAAGELCVAVVMFRAEINACEEKVKIHWLRDSLINLYSKMFILFTVNDTVLRLLQKKAKF